MGEEQKGIRDELEKLGVEFIYDMGTGLWIAKVPVNLAKEQDINARIMDNAMQDRLTSNIKGRGQLESLPLFAYVEGHIEIISGHHRMKSARAAGLEYVIAIIDISGLTRSKIASKQLAHNAIEGVDDENTLRQICKLIDSIDDMMESAVREDLFKEMDNEIGKLATPSVSFDFKLIQFTFLPHQFDAFEKLIKASSNADLLGVADIRDFEPFVKTLGKVQKFHDVKAVGTAIGLMTKTALEALGESGFEESVEYVPLASVIGGGAMPSASADIIKKAIKKAEDRKEITKKDRWKLFEILAERYLDEK